MTSDNAVLFGLVALIAVNYLIPRTSLARRYPALFWAITIADLAVGVAVLLFGLPGFGDKPLVRLMVGLLVLLHLAQNFQTKTRWAAEDRLARLDEERAKLRED